MARRHYADHLPPDLGDNLQGVISVEVIDGRITNFYVMRNPEKLATAMPPRQLSR
jgi:RNA polymerase sigma-70 factor (ECF subfamily)